MFHRSERLLLRPLWPEDWRAVFEGIADEAIVRNLASAPWPYRPEDAQAFVALSAELHFPRLAITLADGGRLIGCIGIDPCGEGGDLGYWIARPHWGLGYGTEAGRGMREIARMLGHARLTASHFVDNPASGRVLQKIGFTPTGVMRKRTSRGRGAAVMTVDYALDLVADDSVMQRAA